MSEIPFIITVDTEGDNLWARPRDITTRNAGFLPRFQALCERFRFKPVYLTNYEMAMSDTFRDFGRDVVQRSAGEIGMHLHAWNSPPLTPLSRDDLRFHPYLPEYPDAVMREKISSLTRLLEERFEQRITSHRAGRWGFDGRYAAMLLEQGYRVDCSVTPFVDWRANPGAPDGEGGPDYRHFPRRAYYLDPVDIMRSADEGLLEVPMTVRTSNLYRKASIIYQVPLLRRVANRVSPGVTWLCPIQPTLRTGLQRHLKVMLSAARRAKADADVQHLQFMVHSSELMPGGSPEIRSHADIELLYEHLERLFTDVSQWCCGRTLSEFASGFHSASELATPKAAYTAPGAAQSSGGGACAGELRG